MTLTRRTLLSSSAATALLAATGKAPAKPVKKPNIIVLLADDMGFSDIGCYGSEIPTPNLDALAADGIRFTQFYNCARCSPSRASLLTGAYPSQTGVGHLETLVVPASKGLHGKLENKVATFAELLRGSGYYTAMCGKWHLGMSHGVNPWDRGFDHSMVSPHGAMYFPDQVGNEEVRSLYINGRHVSIDSPEVGNGHWYSSDMFVEWALKFIREAQDKDQPFVLYLAFAAPHFPVMAPQEDIDRFKGHYKAGWDVLREARFKRQKDIGIVPSTEILPPREPNTYNWDKLSPPDQDRFDTIMSVYAADISRMDKAVGTLTSSLKDMGLMDDTLILFMSDNGGNAEGGPDGQMTGADPGGPKSNIFVGMNWATLQNTPFRYFKHFVEEGGIATPLIAHWPRGIKSSLKGTFVREPSHFVDVMASLLDVSGTIYPKTYAGHPIVPMQGRSFAPAFQGRALHRTGPIFWEHEGNRAVRDGNWKLVAINNQSWCLYDMAADRSETRDVAAANPEHVTRMANQWDEWASRSDIDVWEDRFDNMLKGPRQNWGTGEQPKIPQAMDLQVTW